MEEFELITHNTKQIKRDHQRLFRQPYEEVDEPLKRTRISLIIPEEFQQEVVNKIRQIDIESEITIVVVEDVVITDTAKADSYVADYKASRGSVRVR